MNLVFRLAVVLVLLVAVPALAADSPAEMKGRITGRVTVKGSGAPVEGAKIPITIGAAEWAALRYDLVHGVTDKNGRYSVEVPLGNVWISTVEVPAGYWQYEIALDRRATTRAKPMIEKDFEVKVGDSWPVRVFLKDGRPLSEGTVFISELKSGNFGKATPDRKGTALLPVPVEGGEFQLAHYSERRTDLVPAVYKLSMDENFNAHSVDQISKSEGTAKVQLVDKQGRKATIEGTNVAIFDSKAEIQFVIQQAGPTELGTLAGSVIDQDGRPIEGVRVAFQGAVLPQIAGGRSSTNPRGEFRVENIVRDGFGALRPDFGLIVTKDGYVGVDVDRQPFRPDENGLQRIDKPIILRPGYSARVRVLDKEGNAAEGAWLEPRGSSADRAQFARSDAKGFAMVRNVPEGVQGVHVYFGDQAATGKVVVSKKQTDDVATIRLQKWPPDPAEIAEQKESTPLKAGEIAPDWSITEWTDGNTRKLSDFRGKVVVLDFWGIWCYPCVQSIPAMKKIEEKYRGKEIVFIGMHTAGTEMSQVKKLLELKEWNLLTGIEEGNDQTDSVTAKRYGVRGYPTTVIVDRKGRISTNTSDDDTIGDKEKVMAKAEAMAKEAGLPWPIKEDSPEEETQAWFNRLQVHMLSKEIDKALASN
jgi:thiol-disulfide isomerase/thioredoxin